MSEGGAGHDPIGEAALETISELGRFNRWMYETIRPHCHGRMLEVGSGIGNLSRCFLDDGCDLVLSDLRAPYVRRLQDDFPGRRVESIDLVHPRFEAVYGQHLGAFDTVFALNVVEHIADDVKALENCRRLVRAGGAVVILVPAYEWLHNRLDVHLGHYRRYTRGSLVDAFGRAGLEVTHTQYFNAVATAGWAMTGGLFAREEIPHAEASLFDRLVPLWRWVDKAVGERFGLSVIAVGRAR
jgi:SAM-dependent methyltransferase